MASNIIIAFLTLIAVFLFISSQAAARELAEDSKIDPNKATSDHSEVGDAKYYGYGGYGPGYGGYGGYGAYGGYGGYRGYGGYGGYRGYGGYGGYGRGGYGWYPRYGGGWYGGGHP